MKISDENSSKPINPTSFQGIIKCEGFGFGFGFNVREARFEIY